MGAPHSWGRPGCVRRSFAVLTGVVVAFAFLLACGGSPPPPAPAPAATTTSASAAPDRVDGAAAHKLVQEGATLVDVRSADEYAQKHIEGAVSVPATSGPMRYAQAPAHRLQRGLPS